MSWLKGVIKKDNEFNIFDVHKRKLPVYIQNDKFIDVDENHINDFLNRCENHNQEYLYPDGYGIVIVDFDDKEIYDLQEYTSLHIILGGELMLEYRENVFDGNKIESVHDKAYRLHEKGLLKGLTKEREEIDISSYSFDYVIQQIAMTYPGSWDLKHLFSKHTLSINDLLINWEKAGWNLYEVPEDYDYIRKLKRIVDRKYGLSDFSKEKWDEFGYGK